MPLPNALWTDEYKRFNAPLTFWLNCGLICIPFYCPAVATVHMGSLTPPPAILGQSPLPPSPPPSPAALYHFFPPNSSLPRPHLSGANDPTDLSGVLFSNLPVRGRRAVLVSLRKASVSSPCRCPEETNPKPYSPTRRIAVDTTPWRLRPARRILTAGTTSCAPFGSRNPPLRGSHRLSFTRG